MKNINFDESRLLALYFELFRQCYDVKDERKDKEERELVRHIEMQNACCLFKRIGIPLDYSFYPDFNGVSSPRLKVHLRHLDKKKEDIEEFYDEYIEKRNQAFLSCRSYQQQLEEILPIHRENMERLPLAIYLFEDIEKQEKGIETVGSMIYTTTVQLPGADFSMIHKKLSESGYEDIELNKTIWKYLTVLDVINIKPNYITDKSKVLRK